MINVHLALDAVGRLKRSRQLVMPRRAAVITILSILQFLRYAYCFYQPGQHVEGRLELCLDQAYMFRYLNCLLSIRQLQDCVYQLSMENLWSVHIRAHLLCPCCWQLTTPQMPAPGRPALLLVQRCQRILVLAADVHCD